MAAVRRFRCADHAAAIRGLCLPCNEALTSGLPVIMSHTSPNDAVLPADWLVPGAFNGGFTSRVPIPYFNVNIAALARKLDEWAAMPDEVLDQHKARASSCHDNSIRRRCGRSTRQHSGGHRTPTPTLAHPNQVVRLRDLWLGKRIRYLDAALL